MLKRVDWFGICVAVAALIYRHGIVRVMGHFDGTTGIAVCPAAPAEG
jgi:hypothetical protein